MNNKPYLSFLLLFIILAPLETNAKSLSDSEFEDVVQNGFVVDVNADEEQIKMQLGQPIEINKVLVDNPYSKAKDQVIRYIYSGLEITFYDCRNPQSLWKKIVQIMVSSNKYTLKHGIRVGMKFNELNKLFVDNHNRDGWQLGELRDRETWQSEGFNYYSYSMPLRHSAQINVAVKNDIVQQVIWSNEP